MSNDLDAAAESLLQAAETITTLRKQLEQVTAERDALHSMVEHYKECINKQLEKIRDQEFAISELSRLLEEGKKLSAAISRDCNATALERNELRGKFDKLSAKYAELGPLAQKLMEERDAYRKLLERVLEEAEDRMDVIDGNDGPRPDAWMDIANEVALVLEKYK